MTKAPLKTEPVPRHSNTFLFVAFGIIIAWLTFLTVYVVTLNNQLTTAAFGNAQTMLDSAYRTYRLGFCLNNGLRPCDDATLRAFNEANPSAEQFNFTQPKIRG